jgi:hypothetical protein
MTTLHTRVGVDADVPVSLVWVTRRCSRNTGTRRGCCGLAIAQLVLMILYPYSSTLPSVK